MGHFHTHVIICNYECVVTFHFLSVEDFSIHLLESSNRKSRTAASAAVLHQWMRWSWHFHQTVSCFLEWKNAAAVAQEARVCLCQGSNTSAFASIPDHPLRDSSRRRGKWPRSDVVERCGSLWQSDGAGQCDGVHPSSAFTPHSYVHPWCTPRGVRKKRNVWQLV